MADFGGMVLTDVGKNLQAQVQSGELLNFTRIALGDGTLASGGLEGYTALESEKKSIAPTSAIIPDPADGTVTIRGTLTNTGMASGFFIREIGLFAEDPDDAEAEILYAIAYASNPDYLPAAGGATAVEQIIDLVTVISNATNVTVTIDGDHYLTDTDLDEHNADASAHTVIRAAISAEIDADIATHNADGDAHPAIRAEIDDDITVHDSDSGAHPAIRTEIDSDIATHNADGTAHGLDELGAGFQEDIDDAISAHNVSESAHPAIRDEIDDDISAHDADNNSHDLATKLSAIQTEIDDDVSAHNGNSSAHTAIQNKIGTDISAHNVSESAHPAIRDEIDDDISAHNSDGTAHGIQAQIAAHDVNEDAHADLMSGVSGEIDSDISAHNSNSSAHTAIQNKIGTDIAAHNASNEAHSAFTKRGAVKAVRQVTSNITAVVGDRILANTSGGAFTVTMPSSANSAPGDAVLIIDDAGSFETSNLTIGRNGLKIMGLSEDMACDISNAAFKLVRNSDGWRIA